LSEVQTQLLRETNAIVEELSAHSEQHVHLVALPESYVDNFAPKIDPNKTRKSTEEEQQQPSLGMTSKESRSASNLLSTLPQFPTSEAGGKKNNKIFNMPPVDSGMIRELESGRYSSEL
jgi:hypothetical protein